MAPDTGIGSVLILAAGLLLVYIGLLVWTCSRDRWKR